VFFTLTTTVIDNIAPVINYTSNHANDRTSTGTLERINASTRLYSIGSFSVTDSPSTTTINTSSIQGNHSVNTSKHVIHVIHGFC
jgi:hypothetical protein